MGERKRRLTVTDVMSTEVVSVSPDTPFKDLVRLLRRKRVSALPVLDAHGRPVGIVSEADLLIKAEKRSDDSYLLESRQHRQQRMKAGAVEAVDVMTTPVVTVRPDVPVAHAARTMHERRIKRLPVVDVDGRLAGIVSRGDLLKVFLRPDAELKDEVTTVLGLAARRLGLRSLKVTVLRGVVTIEGEVDARSLEIMAEGEVDTRSLAMSAERLIQGLDGVVGVRNKLRYLIDDRHPADRVFPS